MWAISHVERSGKVGRFEYHTEREATVRVSELAALPRVIYIQVTIDHAERGAEEPGLATIALAYDIKIIERWVKSNGFWRSQGGTP